MVRVSGKRICPGRQPSSCCSQAARYCCRSPAFRDGDEVSPPGPVDSGVGTSSVGGGSVGGGSVGGGSVGGGSVGKGSVGGDSVGRRSLGTDSVGRDSVGRDSVGRGGVSPPGPVDSGVGTSPVGGGGVSAAGTVDGVGTVDGGGRPSRAGSEWTWMRLSEPPWRVPTRPRTSTAARSHNHQSVCFMAKLQSDNGGPSERRPDLADASTRLGSPRCVPPGIGWGQATADGV